MITPDLTRLSPNFYNRPVQGRTVIIHSTRSGKALNPSEFQGTLNYMATPGTTSSHWVISRSGIAARVVADTMQAWHAAEDNDNSWGIELEQGAETDGFTTAQLQTLIAVCKGYCLDFAVPPVHAASSITPGFIGHQETAQGRASGKSDPGRFFDWPAFISDLQSSLAVPPPPPVSVKEGLHHEENFWVLYNGGVPVWRWGSTDGLFPGRVSKLFGDRYLWLRLGPGNRAYWDSEEGD